MYFLLIIVVFFCEINNKEIERERQRTLTMSIKELVEIFEKSQFDLRPFLLFEDVAVGDDHVHYNKMIEELIGARKKEKIEDERERVKELLKKHVDPKRTEELNLDLNELLVEIKKRKDSGGLKKFPAFYQTHRTVDFQLLGANFLDMTKGKGKTITKDSDIVFYIVVGKEPLKELIDKEHLKAFMIEYRRKQIIILYITFADDLASQKNIISLDGIPVFTFEYVFTGTYLDQNYTTFENLYRLNEIMYGK